MRVSFLVAGLVLLSAPALSQNRTGTVDDVEASTCPFNAADPVTSLGLANALLTSLARSRDAMRDGIVTDDFSNADGLTFMTKELRATKTANAGFLCAEVPLAQFAQLTVDKGMHDAAQAMMLYLHQHIVLGERLESLIKRFSSVSQADFADEISTLQVERGKVWKSMAVPVQYALLQLEDSNRLNAAGMIDRLTINTSEKAALFARTTSDFPEIASTPAEKQDDATFYASLYLTLLKSKKASDEH